ncbi:uncharacterized protein B0T23DRAFT_129304 [Neurospora hispaniola]|uniref:Uncharacterized protein n=1 Tax=Neurospora hispaniola TaxID=588809 RepID=A0AAJ0IAW9_9PEZI|nr:hypothetical protein B0T23DRAFT_129304 [Neurospora hispaniola]
MIFSVLCAWSLLNIGRVSTMRQGVWRLAGAFRTANLEPSSRFSTCAPVHKRQGRDSKAENRGKLGQLLDHNGRPLSEEAIAVAREYWRLQRLRHSSPSPPSHMLLHEIQLHRAAYNHVVLNLSRAPGTPVTVTYEPPYIAPSSNECTASHRDTIVRKPHIDLKSEKHTPWQHILDQVVKDFMDKTFGDQWTKNSVPERSSVPPIQQAVDNTDLARIKARNQSGSTWEKLLNWWIGGEKRDGGPGHV